VDKFELEEIKTKKFFEVLKNFDLASVLIVTEKPDANLERSSRNIRKVKLLRAKGLNVYDILTHEYLLFVEPALGIVEEALAK
jgi:large subunit ribosomal protein L4